MKQNDFYYTKIPVVIVTDVEFGPGENMIELPVLPNVMAWSACDDEELVERAAEIMAKICRLHGIAWTLSPVVDINMIFNICCVNYLGENTVIERVMAILEKYTP